MDKEFASIKGSYPRSIDWDASKDVLKPGEFVDRWRIVLWNQAFLPFFISKTSKDSKDSKDSKFVKGSNLFKFPGGPMAIKCVVYRCVFASPPSIAILILFILL